MVLSPRIFSETTQNDGLDTVDYIADPIQDQQDSSYLLGPLGVTAMIGRSANMAEMQLNRSDDRISVAESTLVNALDANLTAESILHVHDDIPEKVKLSVKADNGNNSEATGIILLVGGKFWVGDQPPDAKFKIIQVSSDTAAVANTWTALGLTWPSDLPGSGKMRVLGWRAKSASGYAIRFIQNGRPGIPTQHSAIGPMFWLVEPFEIDLSNKPSLEIASSTTTSAHAIELAVQY